MALLRNSNVYGYAYEKITSRQKQCSVTRKDIVAKVRKYKYDHPIASALVSSSLAVGLYSAAFESVVRLARIAVLEAIEQGHDDNVETIRAFEKARTAAQAIDFCKSYLLQSSTFTADDIVFLHKARKYRNTLVHAAIERLFTSPRLRDVTGDIGRMIMLANAIELWQRSHWVETPGYARVAIMFSGVLQSGLDVAVSLATKHLGEECAVVTR